MPPFPKFGIANRLWDVYCVAVSNGTKWSTDSKVVLLRTVCSGTLYGLVNSESNREITGG